MVPRITVGHIVSGVANSVVSNHADDLINDAPDVSNDIQCIIGIHLNAEDFKTMNDKKN